MPSKKITRKASLVNNTNVFGSMPGNGKLTGRNVLEQRENRAYPNSDPLALNIAFQAMNTQQKIAYLKRNGLWNERHMTGGVGRRSLLYNMQLRW